LGKETMLPGLKVIDKGQKVLDEQSNFAAERHSVSDTVRVFY